MVILRTMNSLRIMSFKNCQAICTVPFLMVFILLINTTLYQKASAQDQQIASHVILLALDGVGSDALQLSETPNLNRIISEGFIAPECRVVLPSVSAPNFTTMLTGVGPSEHGVSSNDWRRDNRTVQPVVTGLEDVFPSIFSWTREQRPESVLHFFYEWRSMINFFETTVMDRVEHEADGETNFRNAMAAFFDEKPELMFLNVDETDAYGHRYSWESEEFLNKVNYYDSLIGEFTARLEDSGMIESTLLMITADHGGIQHSHGGESDEELYVPIIIYGAGVQPGYVYDETCYLYDFAPTAAYAMGIIPPSAVFGRPIRAAFSGGESTKSYVPIPKIRPASGFYSEQETEVTMNVDLVGAAIHYTTDGTMPGPGSPLYAEPFKVSGQTIVRAVSVLGNQLSREQEVFIRTRDESSKKLVEWIYIEGEWKQVPDFDNYPVLKEGNSFEISLDEIPYRDDHFAVRYRATIEIETPGLYTFYTNSDDGSLLYLNGVLVVDNDGSHSLQERSGRVELEAGLHSLEVHYFEDHMGEHLDVSIEGPGIGKQIITNIFFR